MVGEYVLKQHGIDPQNDLNLIQNIDFANIANAYISGTGDFVQLFEPQASMFEKEGRGYIVASFGTESGHVPYTTFMTKQSYLAENEETVEKFTAAIYKAQAWVYENSSAETAKLIEKYFEDTDPEIIESSIERYKNQESFAKNPILDQESGRIYKILWMKLVNFQSVSIITLLLTRNSPKKSWSNKQGGPS